MSYTRKAFAGSTLMFANGIVVALLGYVINIVLARNLSLAAFGLFFAVFGLVRFLLFFRNCGLNTALNKYLVTFRVENDFDSIKTAIFSSLVLELFFSAVLGVGLFLLSDYLALNYFRDPGAEILLKFFMLYIFASVFFQIEAAVFSSFKKFKVLAILYSSRLFVTLICVFLFLKYQYLAPLFAYVAGWLVPFIIFLPSAWRLLEFGSHRVKKVKSVSKQLLLFGLPVVFTGIGARVVGRLDTLILTYFTSLENVGIYNVVLSSALTFTLFSAALSSVLFTFVAEFWHKQDFVKIKAGVSIIYRYLFIFALPFFLLLFAFSSFFIKLVFGPDFVSGALSFQVLLVGVLLFLVASLNNQVISAIGRPGIVTKIVLVAGLVNTVLNLILIPSFGIFGAAITTSASYALMLVLSSIQVSKLVGFVLPIFDWVKTFFVGGVFLGFVYWLKQVISLNVWLELSIICILSLILYVATIFVLKLVDIAEIKKYIRLALKKS